MPLLNFILRQNHSAVLSTSLECRFYFFFVSNHFIILMEAIGLKGMGVGNGGGGRKLTKAQRATLTAFLLLFCLSLHLWLSLVC